MLSVPQHYAIRHRVRSRLLSTILVASSLAVIVGMAPSADARAALPNSPVRATGSASPIKHSDAGLCYSQNLDPTGVAITSTSYSDPGEQYDAAATANMPMPGNTKCIVKEIDISGYFAGGTPPPNPVFNIQLAKGPRKGGAPTKIIKSDLVTCTLVHDGVQCPMPAGYNLNCPYKLMWGQNCRTMMWVMQAFLNNKQGKAMDSGLTWYWDTTADQALVPAMWENPNNGYETGCTDWTVLATCFPGSGTGPNLMYSVLGTLKPLK